MPYYIVETNIRARKIFDKDSDEFTKGKGLSPSPFPYNFRTQEELPEDDLKKFSERLDYYSHQAEGNYVLLRNVPDTKEWFQKTKEVVGDAPSRIAVLDIDDISLKSVPSSSLSERWEQWLEEHHLPHFEAVVKLSQTAYVDFEKPEEGSKYSLHAFVLLPEALNESGLQEAFNGRAVDLSVTNRSQLLYIQKPDYRNGAKKVSQSEGVAYFEGIPFCPTLLPEGETKSVTRQKEGSGVGSGISGGGNKLRKLLEEKIPDKDKFRKTYRYWDKFQRAVLSLSEEDLDGKRNSIHLEILVACREITGNYELAEEFILRFPKILGVSRDRKTLLQQKKKAEEYRKERHALRNGGDIASGFQQDEIFITDKQSAETLTAIEKGKIPEVGVIVANLHCGFGKTSGVIKSLAKKYDTGLFLCHRLSALANLSSELGIAYHDEIRAKHSKLGNHTDHYIQELRETDKLAVTDKTLPRLAQDGKIYKTYKLVVIDEAEHFLRAYREARILENGQNWGSLEDSFRDLIAIIRHAECVILADDCASYEITGWFAELCRQEMNTQKFLIQSSNDWVKGIHIEKVGVKAELIARTWHSLSQGKRIFMPVDVSDNKLKMSRLKALLLHFTELESWQILWFDGSNLEEGVTTDAEKTDFKRNPKKFISEALKRGVKLIMANQIVDVGWNYLNNGSQDERFDEVHLITENPFTTPDKIKSMFRRIRTNLDFVRVFIGVPFNPEEELRLTPYDMDGVIYTHPYKELQSRITNAQKLRGWNIKETFFAEMENRGAVVYHDGDWEMILEGLDDKVEDIQLALKNISKEWNQKLLDKLRLDEEMMSRFVHSETFEKIESLENVDKSTLKKMEAFSSEQCQKILTLWEESTRKELQHDFPTNSEYREESVWIQQRLLQEIGKILIECFGEEKLSNSFHKMVSWVNNPNQEELYFLDGTKAFDDFTVFIKTNSKMVIRRDIFFALPQAEKTPLKLIKQFCKLLFLDLKTDPIREGKSTDKRNKLFKKNKLLGTIKEKKNRLHSILMRKLNEGKGLTTDEKEYLRLATNIFTINKQMFIPLSWDKSYLAPEPTEKVFELSDLAI